MPLFMGWSLTIVGGSAKLKMDDRGHGNVGNLLKSIGYLGAHDLQHIGGACSCGCQMLVAWISEC